MKFHNLLNALSIVLIISCAESQPKEVEQFNSKMEQTIAIHDEVMPELTKINRLIGKLEAKMDSTNADTYKPAIENLKSGHDKMMSWMKDFGDNFSRTEINQGIKLQDVDSLKSRLEVLNLSHKDAQNMQTHIQEAISNAELLLKEEQD